MSQDYETGKLNEFLYETFEVEWEINDFFSRDQFSQDLALYNICSPIFSFSKSAWTIRLWPKAWYDPKYMHVQIENTEGCEEGRAPPEQLECKFGLRKSDGNMFHIRKKSDRYLTLSYAVNIPREELLRRRDEIVPGNTMTVVCTLHRNIVQANEPASIKLKELDTLSENFETLFLSEDGCDVTLQVKDKDFKAHKTILVARSPVFASMFQHDTSESQTGVVKIPDCEPDSFHKFLEYLYSGKLGDVSFDNVYYMYSISDKYEVIKLKSFCVEYMGRNLTVDNVCDVIILADMCDDVKLQSAAQHFFNGNASKIVETTKWINLLKDNHRLANKVIKEMTSKIKIRDCNCSN